MDVHVQHTLQQARASSTSRVYRSVQNKYLRFCDMYKIQPLPITDSVMLRYLAYLDLLGINVRTMRVYLAGIRALQIENGMSEPLIYTPLVQLMVKSFEKSNDAPLRVLPMTYDIMLQVASKLKNGWDDTMVWACMTIAFYGCLRAGDGCSGFCPITEKSGSLV